MSSSRSTIAGPCREVLVVEDETRLREMFAHAIADMGFNTFNARSAEAAMKVLEQQPIDIVVLDLNLPGIPGIDLFESIYRRWPTVQVIILTGFGDLDTARQAIRLNVSDFLTKPCPLGDLELSLDRARQRRLATLAPANLAHETSASPADAPSAAPLTLEEIERTHILAALERNGGNRTATATELGISLRTLYYRLETYQRQGLSV